MVITKFIVEGGCDPVIVKPECTLAVHHMTDESHGIVYHLEDKSKVYENKKGKNNLYGPEVKILGRLSKTTLNNPFFEIWLPYGPDDKAARKEAVEALRAYAYRMYKMYGETFAATEKELKNEK